MQRGAGQSDTMDDTRRLTQIGAIQRNSRTLVLVFSLALLAIVPFCLVQQQAQLDNGRQRAFNLFASASPIVNLERRQFDFHGGAAGELFPFAGTNGHSLGRRPHQQRRHQAISYLREAMPWEDGYFDPFYHKWSNDAKKTASDSKSVKLVASPESGEGGGGGGDFKKDRQQTQGDR